MSEIGDDFKALRKQGQEKRARNRTTSPDLLTEAGISFQERNGGAHLIVGDPPAYDFWPGTGKWIDRSSKAKGRGVLRLVSRIKRSNEP